MPPPTYRPFYGRLWFSICGRAAISLPEGRPLSLEIVVLPSFDVLCAEFGFSYHVSGNDANKKGHARSDAFFKDIQQPLRAFLADGTTKTAQIYGDEETTKA